MTFSDKPEPGTDYISFMLLLNIGGLVIAGWQFIDRKILDSPGEFILFAALCAFGLFMTGRQIHAVCNTEYLLEDDKLTLRQGSKKELIALGSIESIDLVDSLWKSILFTRLGFANRISNLVRLKAEDNKFVLSPTNPQLFISHIRGRFFRGPNYNGSAGMTASSPQQQDSPG